MIRFFVFIIIVFIAFCKYYKKSPFFNIEVISKKYNLVNLKYIYLNDYNYIRKDNIILLYEDALEISNVLEDCYINKIKLNFKRK